MLKTWNWKKQLALLSVGAQILFIQYVKSVVRFLVITQNICWNSNLSFYSYFLLLFYEHLIYSFNILLVQVRTSNFSMKNY